MARARLDFRRPAGYPPGVKIADPVHGETLAVRLLVFKACLAAAWADSVMTVSERRQLSGLIEQLAEGEEERAVFRHHSLAELAPAAVLEQVCALPASEKKAVFERCLAVLSVDRRLNSLNLAFLRELRHASGVGRWAFYRRLWGLRGEGVRIDFVRRAAFVAALIGAGALIMRTHDHARVKPQGISSGREILIAPVDSAPETPSSQLPAETVYRSVRDSFATIEVLEDGEPSVQGSASVLGTDSSGDLYLLTNRHVVQQSVPAATKLTYRARFLSDGAPEVSLDFVSDRADLAVLRLARPVENRPSLALRPRAALAVGQRVFALGSPHGLKATFTAGIISALRDDSLQTDAVMDPGSSGGPLLDSEGRLCGVVTRVWNNGKNFGFALYADDVLALLAERRQKAGRLTP
jgi:S1-C subfamily serine protease